MRLYIHWPFCLRRCGYCDFHARVAGGGVMKSYASALRKELEIRAGTTVPTSGLRSVYLGGGTPSTMSGREVADLLKLTRRLFGWKKGAEVSVEVNPATWGAEDYREAGRAGVNRVSIGAQSMDDRCLRRLGRLHDSEEVRRAVDYARRAGIPSISLDLLYGLPVGWGSDLLRDLEKVLELAPHHLSIYALTLSPRSPLGRSVQRGEVFLPDEDATADEYLRGLELLWSAGYEQYEISNFCLPGHQCRHNLAYWRREDYLGAGSGAHSLWRGYRFHNRESVLSYLESLRRENLPVVGLHRLGEDEARRERIMLGLRTSRGVPENLLEREGKLREMEEYGLLRKHGGRVSLTPRGKLVSNPVIAALLPA